MIDRSEKRSNENVTPRRGDAANQESTVQRAQKWIPSSILGAPRNDD